ncbi:MAG: aspartate aminotransferase family protein [Alphaproteobacteria bacterium]
MDGPRDDRQCKRRFDGSRAHRARALRHVAFGVSSSPRANQQPLPVAIERAEGARVFDVDGNSYVDHGLGYGPLILGHSPGGVIAAVQAEMARGLRTASVHRGEAELAELIAACVRSAEVSAFVSTGSEAIQLALRVARAGTGRLKVAKFRANYHGWFDSVHVAGRPGRDGPDTLGQDPRAAESLVLFDWGDAGAVESALDASFAAVLVEPAAMNAGCFAPPPGFLQRLRDATRRNGAMLVFDEVVTGFRVALGGAQEAWGVAPDICVLGKALGAGFPIGAVSGTREAMATLMDGRLLHRGTFNGNPACVAAAIACLRELRAGGRAIYEGLAAAASGLAAHVAAEAARTGARVCATHVTGALQLFAGVDRMERFADIARADRDLVLRFTGEMLRAGAIALPRGLMYVSTAHGEEELAATRAAITAAMERFAAGGP